MNLVEIDLATEQVRDLASFGPWGVVLEPPANCSSSISGAPEAEIWSKIEPRSAEGTTPSVSHSSSPSITSPHPSSKT